MSVDEFKVRLHALPIKYSDEYNFFKQMYKELDRSTNLDELWAKLSEYWTFLNYSLLENLIRRLNDSNLREEMEDYLNSLQSFRNSTRLSYFVKYYPFPKKYMKSNLKSMVVRSQLDWETCTLEDVDRLEGKIFRKFHLPTFPLILEEFLPGSLIIRWSLPSELAAHVEEQLKSTDIMVFNKENNILSISVDDRDNSDKNGELCHNKI